MRGGSPLFLLFIVAFITVIDAYTFRGVRMLTGNLAQPVRLSITIIYWLIPLFLIILMGYFAMLLRNAQNPSNFRHLFFLMGFFVLFYVPKMVFILFQLGNDIVQFSGWMIAKFSNPESKTAVTASGMSRAEFLTKAGIVVAAIPFLSILKGIAVGRYNYQVKNIKLNYPNLPTSFNGFRILQISDWHIGSFAGKPDKVREAVALINKQKADIILFTGDIVNNMAEELKEFIPILKQLKAKHGVYSILGNHDYGEYVAWESEEAHQKNMLDLYDYQKQAGFKLLRNDTFTLERNGETIGVAGVENWGKPPFPQYGDIKKVMKSLENLSFKILMSHDPSHWDEEVRPLSNFDLTLSGHTHGMQFGINIPGIKWSPVKWKYPRWAGLYTEGNQKLYVNVGIGYIGFPGRVGFLPEITVFELHNQNITA